ncbi:hypothetical protein CHUAL_003487 [Chamberlinius hualienensis]
MIVMILLSILTFDNRAFTNADSFEHFNGPQLVEELPDSADFANTKGIVLSCKGHGNPLPSINWMTLDNYRVNNVTDIRSVLPNGSLIMHPFRPDQYRPDVHLTTLRCHLTNPAGTIKSRDVHLRAVVQQQYEIQVYDTYSIEGNTAVFECHVPPFVSEFVEVVAWIKNDNLLIQPKDKIVSKEKFTMMPNGDLHIQDVHNNDVGVKFKCKTLHRLTGEIEISSEGQLFVTESRGNVAPRILDGATTISASEGKTAILSCAVQGFPIPVLKWYTKSTSIPELRPIWKDKRFIETKSFLIIRNVKISDEGTYVCEATSDIGKETLHTNLTVSSPIVVSLKPKHIQVKISDTVHFYCETSGYPIESISWIHNGNAIVSHSNKKLLIHSVKLHDRGMYQCIAKRGSETYLSASHLDLTEMRPQLIDVFQEAILQPERPISLSCLAVGIPVPAVQWAVDGITLNSSDKHIITSNIDKDGRAKSNLTIASTLHTDSGIYSCTASNIAGNEIFSARINIYGKIGTRTVPTQIAVSGENAYLNCPIYGYPWERIMWVKDEIKLPRELRQLVYRNGTLLIKNVYRSHDNGRYSCNVMNHMNKKEAEGLIELHVMVPPKIVPFEFQEDLLREGMRARLQCVVSEGDLPLNVSWLKDGKPLDEAMGVTIRNLDDFSSILTIASITPSHNGNYTCVASNTAASTSHNAQLSVNGK